MERNYRSFLPISNVSQYDYSSDDEFRSRVSLELCLPENRDAAMKLLADDDRSSCFRVSVKGYDTSLADDEIKLALLKHFSVLCGGVFDVVVPVTNLVDRCAFVYLLTEDAEKRALALDGSDVGGWKAIVRSSQRQRECLLDPQQADILRAVYYHKQCSTAIWVEGYDICLPEDEVKNALIKHFCSCGVITDLSICRDPLTKTLTSMAFLYFYGQEEVEKALALNGSDVGGWTVVVKPIPGLERGPDPCNLLHI
ncbi:unnamed protein product [Arabis nemorensis]|uniref:RRM domain-containing protein n=1 Tax=Arabis nemorensis TaxID=586526 RepID=A0A565C8C1_9BRAS|nr:unnamed protein product [Arabis nemorensis]